VLNEVLKQFSLDEDGSALNKLKRIMDGAFSTFREALGIKAARAEEAARGHVKGFCFEEDLYAVVAEMGRQFGDETELVCGRLTIASKSGGKGNGQAASEQVGGNALVD
jgi:hypothetical protein